MRRSEVVIGVGARAQRCFMSTAAEIAADPKVRRHTTSLAPGMGWCLGCGEVIREQDEVLHLAGVLLAHAGCTPMANVRVKAHSSL